MPRFARLGRVVPVLAVVAALAGCAGVPTSGSVHVGRAVVAAGGGDIEDIRAFPSGPLAGLDPSGVVTGYLDALVDNDSNYRIARGFLAPGTEWNPATHLTLYDANSEAVTQAGPTIVDVHLTRVGVVDARGFFHVAPGPIDERFDLVRQSGQWRISHLPSGVLLSTSDAQRALQHLSLYYLNQAGTRLVPVPVLVQFDQPGLATTLVRAVVAGPPERLAPAVQTAAPSGTDLVGNVPIDPNGVADVNLAGSVQQLPAGQLQRLSAQLTWTLRQVPGVTGLRLLDNGTALADSGLDALQPIRSWAQYDPDTAVPSAGAVLAHDGGTTGLGRPVPSAFVRPGLVAPRLSADGTIAAAVRIGRARDHLEIGSASGVLRSELAALRLSAPAFDPQGNVLVVVGRRSGTVMREVTTAGAITRVVVPRQLLDEGIAALAVSPDGSRLAMVVGPPGDTSLVVATLSSGHDEPVVSGPVTLLGGTHDVSGVAWPRDDRVVTTVAHSARRRAVVEVSVDGYGPHILTTLGLPRLPTQVAGTPGQPILAGAAGAIWSLVQRRWQQVSIGTDPSYAG